LIDPTEERRQRLLGIALMCGAVAFFACLDSTGKYLNGYMNTLEVVWARYLSGFAFAVILSNPIKRPALMKTSRPLLQIARSGLLLSATILNLYALRWLQLDQTTSILFGAPFLVALLSGPLLDEWVGWRRFGAILVGFAGVLVVTRPGLGGLGMPALFSVGGMCCYALYIITTRILARTDSSQTTLFYSNLLGAVAMSVIVPFIWTPPDGWFIVVLMVMTGAFGSVGHYMLIAAHRLTAPVVLAPFMYLQLVWAIILSYFVFADLPNRWTWLGAAIVVSSGLYLLHRERRVGKAPAAAGLAAE
jgi:drug/metabolite transporter (DMT)-like permease